MHRLRHGLMLATAWVITVSFRQFSMKSAEFGDIDDG